MQPLLLPANTPRSFYRGAGRIAAFRGDPPPPDPYYPEDWIGSTTSRFGASPAGLTRLPEALSGGEAHRSGAQTPDLAPGRLLADAIAADPEPWLGPAHLARHGADPAILVKLLDAGERLPLHVHPDRRFALRHLASSYGKTEAWVIVDAPPDAVVHLGFYRDVEPAELASWVAGQRVAEMLAVTNRVPVRPGDAVLCPAGLPHAIGEGVLLVEVQEPTDFSVLLEWTGFAIDGTTEGHLGLGFGRALACVDRSAWPPSRIAGLFGRDGSLPVAADEYFRADRVHSPATLDPGFSVLVVLSGTGVLETVQADLPVRAGHTVLIPYAAGPCRLRGELTGIRCRPSSERPRST